MATLSTLITNTFVLVKLNTIKNKQSHKNVTSTRRRTSHSTNWCNGGKSQNASKMAAIISSRGVKTGLINKTGDENYTYVETTMILVLFL